MHDKMKSRTREDVLSQQSPRIVRPNGRDVANELPRPLLVNLVRRELEKLRRDRCGSLHQRNCSANTWRSRRFAVKTFATGHQQHRDPGPHEFRTGADYAAAARQAIVDAAAYNNLEYDVAAAARGDRGHYLAKGLFHLSGAEAATVVNNCAAALLLIAHHFVRAKLNKCG